MLPRSFFAMGRASVGPRVLSLALITAGAATSTIAPTSCAAGNELGTGGTTSAEESSASVTSGAASTTGVGGDPGSSTSATTSSAGSGGAGGSSGAGSTTASSSTAASSSAASSGGSGSGSGSSSSSSGSGGAPPTGTVLLLAGGGPKVLAAEFHPGAAWSTTQLSSTTDKAPGIAITGANTAVGVIRNTTFGNEVAYTTWAPGSFQAFTSIANAVTTQAAPAIVASGARADVVFLGDNNKHYYAAHVATWSPTAEAVAVGMVQSSGPTPAGVTAIGSDTIVAFAGDNGELYDQTRTGGGWLAANAHNLGNVVTLSPALIAPTTGPALMIVYVRNTDSKMLFTTRTGNVWTAPTPIDASSFTADPVALVALPGGEAILAFRGLNQAIYSSRYNPAGAPLWSPPQPLATPNVTTPSRPALAAGVGGVDAEIAFVNAVDSKAYHARLTGMTWSAPALVGGTLLTTISLASAP